MNQGYTRAQAQLLIQTTTNRMTAPFSMHFASAILEDVKTKAIRPRQEIPLPPEIRAQEVQTLNELWPVFRLLYPKGRYGVTIFDSANHAVIIDSQVWEKTIPSPADATE